MKKIIFYLIWLLVISIGPLTVLKVTPLSYALTTPTLTINFFQRIVGLLAFSMLFWQIILGTFMQRLTEKLGGWIFKFHVLEGAVAYTLVLLHPLLFVLFNFKTKGIFDPFYVFTDVCVLCANKLEFLYTLGRVGFWLITLAVVAAELRTQPWLRIHWRKFHIFNYFAFLLVAVHARGVGTDVRFVPFVWFYWIAVIAVVLTIFYKFLYPKISKLLPSQQKLKEAK
jgi:predicted ferric reductase